MYWSIFALILDHRGITQEVSLITKHGVETKNYETVSIYNEVTITCSYYTNYEAT